MRLLCYFSLAMSLISFWIKKSVLFWGSFLILAVALALAAKIITPIALIPITILFLCQFGLSQNVFLSPSKICKGMRFILFGIIVIVSLALAFHFLPGFNNWKIAESVHISPNAPAYSLYFNFDKPFIGLFVLAFALPVIQSKKALFKMLKITIPLACIGTFIMISLSLALRMIQWDPKMPAVFAPWIFSNFVFVCIPEECFFRGFIQRELYHWFGRTTLAAVGAIALSSLFFALLHLIWVGNYGFLCLVFVASCIYGILYQWTNAIESSILCHFLFNLTHFLLFTYPVLA
jgi:membrane protease YdiL (CAAX protease family)